MEIQVWETGMFQANCYLIQEGETGIVVDPGADAPGLIDRLEEEGVRPQWIVITHGHFDHLGAASALAQHYEIPIVLHAEEAAYMRETVHPLLQMFEGVHQEFLAALPQWAYYVQDGDQLKALGQSFAIVEVPGHSDHSICLYCAQEKALFCGDTLFAGSVGRTDLYRGEPGDLVENIKERLLKLPEDTRVYPGHGPATRLGREAALNPFLK